MTVAIIIFALAYLGIAGQRLPFTLVDRPAAALVGAVAMVAFGVLSVDQAYAAIHMDTLLLLLGMMLIAAYLTEAGFFRTTAWWILSKTRSARGLLWALVLVSGGLSALLVNDTVCLMFTPLVVALVTEAELPPLPYLLALACASNVGSAATFTGNPQNMMIGSAAGATLTYLQYVALAAPIALLGLGAVALIIGWLFRRELPRGTLPTPHLERPPFRRWLALKGVLAPASTLAGNLTVFGSMANLIVLERAGPHGKVGFRRFLRVGSLVTLATLGIATAVIAVERAVI